MLPTLSPDEIRVLGALAEKEMATPDHYPLSLNALVNACNQKSNRTPVMTLDETEVVRALESLRFKGLALQSASGGRVPKYAHSMSGKLHLDPGELAVLTGLLLRGPQTVGELRGRCERLYPFDDLAAVEEVLKELAEREPPLVSRLSRQPGRKEHRFAQLLGGTPAEAPGPEPPPEAATARVRAENERLASLESEVAALRAELAALQEEFQAFRKQFE